MQKNNIMKRYLIIAVVLFSLASNAQQKKFDKAIVSTTMNIIAPDEEDVQNLQSNPDFRGGMNFRNMMDGETKFVTYVKNDSVKTNIKSDMGRFNIYRDNAKKSTTTIMEMMGNKSGFFTTDEEQAQMQKQRDSMIKERRKRDTTSKQMPSFDNSDNSTEVSISKETKKIASFLCTKAYLITTRFLGRKDTATVWFTPEFSLKNINSTGGFSNLPGMMSNMAPTLNGLDKINGFVMGYSTKMRRNRTMEVEVTKIELGKEIDDKEFTIPKDIEIKPMKEMRMMFGGGGREGFMRGGRD